MINVHELNDEMQQGLLVTYMIEEYGITTPFFIPSENVLASQLAARQTLSGMPKEYVYKSGKDFDWTCYKEDVQIQSKIVNAFIENIEEYQKEGRCLYIYSQTKGSGKTMLACCIANEILKVKDLTVKFINVTDYVELVKGKSEEEHKRLKSIMNASILILDDIGAQIENKDWISTALFRLVEHRNVNMLPTIYTSNVKCEDLKTDERIMERIYELSIKVMMPEVNIRRRNADRKTAEFLKKLK